MSDGEVKDKVKSRIGKAARAFGCLQRSIFNNCHLSVETKRKVYGAAVLSVLLYGAETWTAKAESIRHLSGFHNRCIRTIIGVSKLLLLGWKKEWLIYSRNIVYGGLGTWPVWNHIECQSNYSASQEKAKPWNKEKVAGHGSC